MKWCFAYEESGKAVSENSWTYLWKIVHEWEEYEVYRVYIRSWLDSLEFPGSQRPSPGEVKALARRRFRDTREGEENGIPNHLLNPGAGGTQAQFDLINAILAQVQWLFVMAESEEWRVVHLTGHTKKQQRLPCIIWITGDHISLLLSRELPKISKYV